MEGARSGADLRRPKRIPRDARLPPVGSARRHPLLSARACVRVCVCAWARACVCAWARACACVGAPASPRRDSGGSTTSPARVCVCAWVCGGRAGAWAGAWAGAAGGMGGAACSPSDRADSRPPWGGLFVDSHDFHRMQPPTSPPRRIFFPFDSEGLGAICTHHPKIILDYGHRMPNIPIVSGDGPGRDSPAG